MPIATRPVWDIDAWWIAAAGRDIASTGHVPHVNGWSFVEPQHPWILHEWLYAVLFGAVLGKLGPAGLAAIAGLGAWTVLGLVLLATLGRARRAPSALALSLLLIAGLIDKLDSPRPLYLSIAFVLAMTHLAFARRFSWRSAAGAVALELVWANAHGSFPLGLALLGASAVEAASDRARRVAALVACVAATFANPYGARLYEVVLRYGAGGDRASELIRSTISGFQPLWRAPWTFVDAPLVVAFAAAVLLGAAALRDRERRVRALVSLGLCALAVLHVRNLAVAVCVTAVLLARTGTVAPREVARRMALALAPPLLFGLAAFSLAARTRAPDAWIASFLGGSSFVRLAAQLPDGARVFVPFRSTGLLVWLEAPRGVRTLFDARNDCYSPDVIEAAFALNMQTLSPEATREKIERWGTDHAIVDDRDVAFGALQNSGRWSLVARDGDWALLRSPSSFATPR